MDSGIDDLIKRVSDVKTQWALAAFTIAAILVAFNLFILKPTPTVRKALWMVVALICIIAILPMITSSIVESRAVYTIYRVRVTIVDGSNMPVAGASVRATSASEVKTAADGSCELAVPKGSLPQDGKVTIFVDKGAAFLHGRKEIKLGGDPNPSEIIPVERDQSAGFAGKVTDESNHVLRGVRVSVPGAKAVITDDDGNFEIPPRFGQKEPVLLHFEKPGYKAVDFWESAGDQNLDITLPHEPKFPR